MNTDPIPGPDTSDDLDALLADLADALATHNARIDAHRRVRERSGN